MRPAPRRTIFTSATVAVGCLLLLAPSTGHCQTPLEVLRFHIQSALEVLNDPAYADKSRQGLQQQELWRLLQSVFDFEEFSRRVLARNWQRLSPRQRGEFVDLFGRFLGRFYLSRLQRHYANETVDFIGQQRVGETEALVDIHVMWRNQLIPAQVRMVKRRGKWKACDVTVLGINAVSNYRAQFDAIFRRETAAEVLDRLREKLADSP
jgi:phospholipid transport system substrate-binding protein